MLIIIKAFSLIDIFNQLYKQECAVETAIEGADLWAAAASGEEQVVMLSYFSDDDNAPEKTVKVEFKNVENKKGVRLEYYCLNADCDCELVREEIFTSAEFASYVKLPLYTTYLLKIVGV